MPTKIQTYDIADRAVTGPKLAIPTTKGDLLGYGSDVDRVPVGSNGQVLTADSTQALGIKWAAAPSSSATTKGDLAGYGSGGATRIPVGSNGQVLIADSAQDTGVRWGTLYNFADNEVPSGTVNGVNTTFTLAHTPTTGCLHLYKNGLRLTPGSSYDYTISTATITFMSGNIPQTGDLLLADYRY